MAGEKKKHSFRFNIGTIPFLMILIYILGHLIISASQDDLAVYEVIQSQIHESIQSTGLILRNETVIKGKNSGYINYYVSEGELVAKNGLVYSCDETGEVHDYISNLMEQQETVSAEEYTDIRDTLKEFSENYSDSKFQYIYDLKYNLENQALKLGDTVMNEHMNEIESKMGNKSFIKNYSVAHGIVTYVEDGYEGKKLADLTAKDFEVSSYKKIDLKKNKKIEKGESVYRLTESQEYQIVFLLNKQDYKKVKDKKKLTVHFADGEYSSTCPVTFKKKSDGYYAVLTLRNYLPKLVTERYVDLEIEIKSEEGLKIPNTAIVEKEFYKIPEAYLTGRIVSSKTLMVKKIDKKGKISFESLTVDIGKRDREEGYYYVLKEDVPDNTLISMPNSDQTMLLQETVSLPGVYNINRGYADFRCVDILMENEDYTIVRKQVQNSIALFDRIALNANATENNEIIK